MGQMGKAARPASAAEAAALVRSGDWVDYGFGIGQPDAFDQALAARKDELVGVKIRAALSLRARQVLEELIRDHPESNHAANAHHKLHEIEEQELMARINA